MFVLILNHLWVLRQKRIFGSEIRTIIFTFFDELFIDISLGILNGQVSVREFAGFEEYSDDDRVAEEENKPMASHNCRDFPAILAGDLDGER